MLSSRSASVEPMAKRRNSRNRRSSRKKRFNGCSWFQKKFALTRQPLSPNFPNLRQNRTTSAYEKGFLHFNDGARHTRRAFFCYGYFPDCIRGLHRPFAVGDAYLWNAQSRRPTTELGRHGGGRRVARRKHVCRRRKLRHVLDYVV